LKNYPAGFFAHYLVQVRRRFAVTWQVSPKQRHEKEVICGAIAEHFLTVRQPSQIDPAIVLPPSKTPPFIAAQSYPFIAAQS
jgi:hypothetical protein